MSFHLIKQIKQRKCQSIFFCWTQQLIASLLEAFIVAVFIFSLYVFEVFITVKI